MFRDRFAHKYLRLAIEEPSIEVAKEIFAVSRRCQELANKNRRLLRLVERASILMNEDTESLRFPLGKLPDSWEGWFDTEMTKYVRRYASTVECFESRLTLERGADDIKKLEGRNRVIRDTLDRFVTQFSDDKHWADWIESYKNEKEVQGECYCCGMGCHMCHHCHDYHHRQNQLLIQTRAQVA